MTIEARCKLISLQFVVCPLTLYVRLMIIFVPYGTKEVKKDGEMSRTAHDCHTHFIYQLFSALICTGGYGLSVFAHWFWNLKLWEWNRRVEYFLPSCWCQFLSVPIGGDWDQLFTFISFSRSFNVNNDYMTWMWPGLWMYRKKQQVSASDFQAATPTSTSTFMVIIHLQTWMEST